MPYFTQREGGELPRTSVDLTLPVVKGIVGEIHRRATDRSFGASFPATCWEYPSAVIGTNEDALAEALRARFGVEWPLDPAILVGDLVCLNLIEFTYSKIGEPVPTHLSGGHSDYAKHDHLRFDLPAGRAKFRSEINDIFALNGIAFDLGADGEVHRLADAVLAESLAKANFWTGDKDLDALLEDARRKFLSPDPKVRKEALEKLWDAFERLKTVEMGKDKKAQVAVLLDKASGEAGFRARLDAEMSELTYIGNNFQIRHWETSKPALEGSQEVDYLFHRLFGLIRFLLIKTGRSS